MEIDKFLQSQGFGSRKECALLAAKGQFSLEGQTKTKGTVPPLGSDGCGTTFSLAGQEFQYREKVLIALNKPLGYECSHNPQHHPSVFELFPNYLVRREIQPIGRLDQDTTGLLLFTDDGSLIHRLSSPKHHVLKTYQVLGSAEFTDEQMKNLTEGVLLRGETAPDRALTLARPDPSMTPWRDAEDTRVLEIGIDQGKYHQVRRMIAAAGNHCLELHRISFGDYRLEDLNLSTGSWAYLELPL